MAKQQVVSVGDIHEVEAIRLNDDGEGVVSIHGFTVFVPGLLPEEQGRIEISSTGKSFARGHLLQRMSVSNRRVVAPCPVFDTCGGCQLQHVSYQDQLLHKQQTVQGALRGVGKFETARSDGGVTLEANSGANSDVGSDVGSDAESSNADSGGAGLYTPDRDCHRDCNITEAGMDAGVFENASDVIQVRPVLGMETPWRYRNHVQVPIQFDGKGNYKMGFYAPESHTLVPADVCLLEPAEMEQTARRVAAYAAENMGDAARHIHHLILRYSFSMNEVMVVLSVGKPISLQHHAENLRLLPYVASVAVTVQPNLGGGSVWGPKVELLAGKSVLTERLKGVEYRISPRSFFQVNPVQTQVLYQQVEQAVKIEAGTRVLDAYCGTGTIALWLAKAGAEVTGIESIEAAVDDARLNAKLNHIHNVRFVCGKVEKELPRLVNQGHNFDIVVVDPPRKGLDRRVVDTLLNEKPEKIVYVSCNPSTLARDLRIFHEGGYRIGSVQPVDMFPQTSHVECVTALTYHP
ncbi:23S rRNA (uracil(1939)-C(5))-methyltransferase RlmD [Alicyclobacillus sp. SO9]|uniref:23S rRNA (uracil(1939)-C(5))-methyltransferase RlmD n=1 Tax=Alicyclobacillus sp. SO9 TaxID=2665646 RepID=UPI0018E71949|nr:23S rRNA (uracil(1939)-C(5))-methyltransferase RlmD [Alicyclobacillus sp. SO9]